MRESFGGAFMIKLVIIFIVIYVTFMCLALNYARAFRVKNRVINILEQHQFSGAGDNATLNEVGTYLDEVHYIVPLPEDKTGCDTTNTDTVYYHGVCITGYGSNNAKYYKVTTYIIIDFQFFNLRLPLRVSGETKTIEYIDVAGI